MPTQDHFSAAYARLAPVYDWVFGWSLEPGRKAMQRELDRLRPTRLLEIGVGTGLALKHYPTETEIHGVDVCPEMLELAKRNARRLKGRSIRLHLMDAESLNYPNHSFDCVTIPYVLSVTNDPHKLIEEARRVCKPTGTILIVNHFSEGGVWERFEWLANSLSRFACFHAKFDYEDIIGTHDWRVLSKRRVNALGLSRLVVIDNGSQ